MESSQSPLGCIRRTQNIGFQPDWMLKQQRAAEERKKVQLVKETLHENKSPALPTNERSSEE
jgi:hypothetical protein